MASAPEQGDLSLRICCESIWNSIIKCCPYTFDLSLYHELKNKELLEHVDRVGKTFYIKKKVEEK